MVIQGVRRCGKSTLLAQILTQQKLDPRACFFVNFEDPRLAENLDTALFITRENAEAFLVQYG